jgi:hypothetical protein
MKGPGEQMGGECFRIPELLKDVVHKLAPRVDDLRMTKYLRMAQEETADEGEAGTGFRIGATEEGSNGETKPNINLFGKEPCFWNCPTDAEPRVTSVLAVC